MLVCLLYVRIVLGVDVLCAVSSVCAIMVFKFCVLCIVLLHCFRMCVLYVRMVLYVVYCFLMSCMMCLLIAFLFCFVVVVWLSGGVCVLLMR